MLVTLFCVDIMYCEIICYAVGYILEEEICLDIPSYFLLQYFSCNL